MISNMKCRWHKYRLVLPTESSFYLFNFLNKAAIRISRRRVAQSDLCGDFNPFVDDSLNHELSQLSFIVPQQMTDGDLLSHWFRCLCRSPKTFEWLLLLTNQCNFTCPYCFQEADPDFRRISDTCWPEVTEWMISAIFQRRPRYVRVAFFGGEPLQEYRLLEETCSALRGASISVGAAWRADLVTNGYCLDDGVLRRLCELGLKRVQITLDGPPEIHNYRRPLGASQEPTFDEVLKGIESAAKHPAVECVVRTNIDSHNIDHYPSILDLLAARDLKEAVSLSIVPTQPACQTAWHWNSRCFSRVEARRHLGSCIGDAVRRGFRVVLRSLESGPCISITRGGLVIEPNGDVSKCHHLGSDPRFVLGNVLDGAPLSVFEQLRACLLQANGTASLVRRWRWI